MMTTIEALEMARSRNLEVVMFDVGCIADCLYLAIGLKSIGYINVFLGDSIIPGTCAVYVMPKWRLAS